MDNEKQVNNQSSINKVFADTYVSKLMTEDVEFTLHIKKVKNPGELLEKLYLLRENTDLSDDEKNEEVKKIISDYMRWFILRNAKHSLILNLSNQANTFKGNKSNLRQFNFVTILGLEYLSDINTTDLNPVALYIDKDGNLSINGIDGELLDDKNIFIYTDKKVTKSDQDIDYVEG